MSRSIVAVQSTVAEAPIGELASGTLVVPGWRGMGTATGAVLQFETQFLAQTMVAGDAGLAYMTTAAVASFSPGAGAPRLPVTEVASTHVSTSVYVPSWGFGTPFTHAHGLSGPVPCNAVPRADFTIGVAFASRSDVYHNGAPVPAVYGVSFFNAWATMRYDVEARQYGAAADHVTGTSYADSVDMGLGNDWFSGGRGNDYAWGGLGNDTIAGGVGNDTLVGMDGADSLVGDAGDDLLSGGAGRDILIGADGDDQLAGGDGEDALSGGAGRDKLDGGAGFDVLKGGDDNDTLNGMGDRDQLYGGNGNDVLNGSVGDDLLVGDAGQDILIGGAGRDKLWGAGPVDERDHFVFLSASDSPADAGHDVICDFRSGTDRINLSAIDADPATSANDAFSYAAGPAAHAVWFANGTVLVDVTGDSRADMWIELAGVKQVAAGDFIL